jgi:hypothetical protein
LAFFGLLAGSSELGSTDADPSAVHGSKKHMTGETAIGLKPWDETAVALDLLGETAIESRTDMV